MKPNRPRHRDHGPAARQGRRAFPSSPPAVSPSESGFAERHVLSDFAGSDAADYPPSGDGQRTTRDFGSAVLEIVGALIIVLDDKGRIVRFNREAERVTGYAAEEVVGKPVWDLLLVPEEVAGVRAVFRQLRATGIPNHHENHLLTKAGARRLILWSNSVFVTEAGVTTHVVGTGLDITERRRDETRRHLLYEVSRLLGVAGSRDDTVARVLQTVATVLRWSVGEFWNVDDEGKTLRMLHVWHAPTPKLRAYTRLSLKLSLPMFDGTPGRVLATGRPCWVTEIGQNHHFRRKRAAARAGLRSAVAFPVQLESRILGVMAFLIDRPTVPDDDLMNLFASLGSQIGQFMERRTAERALLEISEREQQRLGEELHDGLGQQLTSLEIKSFGLMADLARKDLETCRSNLQREAREINETLRGCITSARALAHGLARAEVKRDGLERALERLVHLIRQSGTADGRLVCPSPVVLSDDETANHLFRIAREAVSNALKHSRARHITIHLACRPRWLRLQVEDDGVGLPLRRPSTAGIGLELMRTRAQIVGASLEVVSKPRQGVKVTCRLPL